jgi:hypothetical protein
MRQQILELSDDLLRLRIADPTRTANEVDAFSVAQS